MPGIPGFPGGPGSPWREQAFSQCCILTLRVQTDQQTDLSLPKASSLWDTKTNGLHSGCIKIVTPCPFEVIPSQGDSVQPYLSGSSETVCQETAETLEKAGHFLHHSMLLCGFIRLVLVHFLLIKSEEKEK